MAANTTLIGNLASDIELRFTQNGRAVGNATIAVNDRKFDKAKNEYVDGDVWFARCTIWGEMAEQAAQSLAKGTRVIGHGRISERSFEDKEGNQRKAIEVVLEEIGPSLRYASAQVTRTQGQGGGSQARTATNAPAAAPAYPQPAADGVGDVWGAPGAQYPVEETLPF